MVRTRASRRNLLALALAAGLTAAPFVRLEARPLEPRRQATVEPRLEETSPLVAFWNFLVSLWGKDGSHIDPYG
jgi:hypothetical protein